MSVANDFEIGNATDNRGEPALDTCSVTGVYQSACACSVRTAFAAGDPFTPCPRCDRTVEWRLLGGNDAA